MQPLFYFAKKKIIALKFRAGTKMSRLLYYLLILSLNIILQYD